MKIYQIHEQSGMYDSYMDLIVASYLDPEKAERHKAEIEAEKEINNTKAKRCQECWECEDDSIKLNCPEYSPDVNTLECFPDECNSGYYENDSTYTIEEVDVIE